jgi:hypothetical protein
VRLAMTAIVPSRSDKRAAARGHRLAEKRRCLVILSRKAYY